jgi:predicted protein tyrosine phosphatase
MKILTVCQGGAVRSVSMKHLLYYLRGADAPGGGFHDAIPCGVESNTPETIAMLADWADRIVVMQPAFAEHPSIKQHSAKVLCYDVGPDHFGYAFHPALQESIIDILRARPDDFRETGAAASPGG